MYPMSMDVNLLMARKDRLRYDIFQRQTVVKAHLRRECQIELFVVVVCQTLVAAGPAFGQVLTRTSAPNHFWWSIASSADGRRFAALIGGVPYATAIYTSPDSGGLWTSNGAPSVEWWSVASSADGMKLVAAAYGNGGLFTSVDSGATWVSNNVNAYGAFSVACSSDGAKLVAVTGGGQFKGPIFTSTDSGQTWLPANVPSNFWQCVVSSADGTRLVALSATSWYMTTDSGLNWISNGMPSVTWNAIACSADGTKLVAPVIIGGTHRLFTSTDSGVTWVTNGAPVSRVNAVASSADGAKLVAVEPDRIWLSSDSGANWISNNVTGFWRGVAMSADGAKYAVVDAGNSSGGIWVSQTTPEPELKLAVSGDKLKGSWIIPSANFVLQQNSDLTTSNWITVSNPPVLNLTNLHYEVELSPASDASFFRLATP